MNQNREEPLFQRALTKSADERVSRLDRECGDDKSTGLRADDPNDTAKARRLRAELEANEHGQIPLVNGAAWVSWHIHSLSGK